ncbi:MAG: BolA/IbaG family iron-sulfur metabolism protein [Coxiellaceae bacterium]|nr:BolA/IbaG family iron-sulfur metabolism protein [Coxiellaceae bacterium]
MMQAETIAEWIQQGLPDSQVSVDGDGHHFEAVIICPEFEGKNTMTRHRMVYATLGEKMGNEIHALSMKTLTPAESE